MFIYYSLTVVTIFLKCFCAIFAETDFVSEILVKILFTIYFYDAVMRIVPIKTLLQFHFYMFQV